MHAYVRTDRRSPVQSHARIIPRSCHPHHPSHPIASAVAATVVGCRIGFSVISPCICVWSIRYPPTCSAVSRPRVNCLISLLPYHHTVAVIGLASSRDCGSEESHFMSMCLGNLEHWMVVVPCCHMVPDSLGGDIHASWKRTSSRGVALNLLACVMSGFSVRGITLQNRVFCDRPGCDIDSFVCIESYKTSHSQTKVCWHGLRKTRLAR